MLDNNNGDHMNIGINTNNLKIVIPVFTWIWTIGAIFVSAYFSFYLFPSIYEERTSAPVEVHFKTKDPGGDVGDGAWYFPNTPSYKNKYSSVVSDTDFLYYSACEALPISQRAICDTSRNWRKLDPKLVGCDNVVDCNLLYHRLSEEERYIQITGAQAKQGASISLSDAEALSLSNPGGWGKSAAWPIFFISMFLGIKLGRAIGEFAFKPYTE